VRHSGAQPGNADTRRNLFARIGSRMHQRRENSIKKLALVAAALLLLASPTAAPVLADQPGADWISIDQARAI
jgi:hypothetical protein